MENERPRTSIQKPSAVPLVLAVVGLVAAAAGGLYLVLRGGPRPTASGELVSPAAESASGPPAPRPIDASRQRELLQAVSADPLYRSAVDSPDLARTLAVCIENLANEVVPRKQLEPFAPRGRLAVVRRDGRAVVDPESYRRWDAFGDAVASVNAEALATAWAVLQPAVETAFRALGYPQGGVEVALGRALHRLGDAPLQDQPVVVVEGPGAVWLHADPALERLGDVEKQVLRMGPRNGRIVQAKARELARALGFAKPAP